MLADRLRAKGYRIVSFLVPKERSGIISFTSDRYPSERIRQLLREEGVIVLVRAGAVRVSPHFYNDEEDIGTLLDLLP